MTYSAWFWNRIAKSYAAKPVPNEAIYQKKIQATQQWLTSDMTVLEFGCGTGSTALLHAPKVKHYHGIDVSPRMIEMAEEKLSTKHLPNLSFAVGAMEELSMQEAQYDAILGLSILHLMHDPSGVVHKVGRLLKPGGVFVSSTACIKDFMHWFRIIASVGSGLRLMPKVQFFSRQELLAMMNDNGFEIVFELEREKNSEACFLIAKKSR